MFGFKKANYKVKNSNGGTLAGCATKEQAEAKKAEWESFYANDSMNKGMKVYIEACK